MPWVGSSSAPIVRKFGRWADVDGLTPITPPDRLGRWISVRQLTVAAEGFGYPAAFAVPTLVHAVGRAYGIGDPYAPLVAWLTGAADGVGEPAADAVRHLAGDAFGVGAANAALAVRAVAAATGEGTGRAALRVAAAASAAGVGTPAARVVVPQAGGADGTGTVDAAVVARLVADATGIGSARAVALVRAVAAAAGIGAASAAAAIPGGRAPVTTEVTTANVETAYTIPWWSRYLDLVGVGGGAGGRGGGTVIAGGGGGAGQWGGLTLERVEVITGPNQILRSVNTLIVRPGNGSAGSSGGFVVVDPSPGAATYFVVNGSQVLTCGGGAPNGSSVQAGQSPGNFVYQGATYIGGPVTSGSGGAGGAPGGGGNGGNPGIFGGANGGPGAAGRGWVRAYQ
ncbi:minor tail protein [Mycobacterium phage Luke]|uniref:Minor tail protein n=1 Tax=Mycobacterium phage Luke TaxID=2772028 RepID=A0A7L7SU01_9CAUD|nr:minor tail protein [Mycobacterium phage Luke]